MEAHSSSSSSIGDPLFIVQKIFDYAESVQTPRRPGLEGPLNKDEILLLISVQLCFAIKSGRASLLLRVVIALLSHSSLHESERAMQDENVSANMNLVNAEETMVSDIELDIGLLDDLRKAAARGTKQAASHAVEHSVAANRISEVVSTTTTKYEESNKGGMIMTFGKADHGKLGHGDTQMHCLLPTVVTALQDASIVKTSSMSTYAVCIDQHGVAYVWGTGGSTGTTAHGMAHCDMEPQLLEALPSKLVVKDVSCGLGHALFLLNTGKIYAWGNGGNGRLGLGDTSDRAESSPVTDMDHCTIISVHCGASHSLALTDDGEVYCWGKNSQGQCGQGYIEDILLPKVVSHLGGTSFVIVEIAAGWEHSMALTASGEIYRSNYFFFMFLHSKKIFYKIFQTNFVF